MNRSQRIWEAVRRTRKITHPVPTWWVYEDGTEEYEEMEGGGWPTRYGLIRSVVDQWNGLVRYRFPWCCVVAYTWWGFWHGAPAARMWQKHPHTMTEKGREFVPCHRHRAAEVRP